jgi:RNA polymerase sigma-70 factor (ECF subfamily)
VASLFVPLRHSIGGGSPVPSRLGLWEITGNFEIQLMSEMSEDSSRELSARLYSDFVNGDDEAAQAIFDRYVIQLINYAQVRLSSVLQSRIDPEDIVQSAYRSFFRKAREEGLALKRSGDLWRILVAFTLNKTRSYIEKELAAKRSPLREQRNMFWRAAVQRDPSPEETASLIEEVKLFIEQLKPRDRRILELRLRGESIDEISTELANPAPDSKLKPVHVSHATIRRVLRESKIGLERRLLNE